MKMTPSLKVAGLALCVIFISFEHAYGLQIGPLLSTCIDACERGCAAIRTVQASRIAGDGGDNGDGNGDVGLKFELKDTDDPRSALTEADSAAQLEIVASLRLTWDNTNKDSSNMFRIVGEEDDNTDENAIMAFINNKNNKPLKKTIFDDELGEGTPDIDPSSITVFVDPLDGTREFVEGRLENCQVLVGIAIDGEAVAGAIGIPFPSGDLSTEPTIIYGIADYGTGIIGTPLARGPFPLDKHIDGIKYPRPHHATGDSSAPVMEACRQKAISRFGGSNVIYGGAGNKILAAALGEVSCSIQHKIGGAWDLCAPEAILKAMGGKMTDLFGEEIEIYKNDAPARCNERGYLATPPGSEELFHEALAAAVTSLPEVQQYKEEVNS